MSKRDEPSRHPWRLSHLAMAIGAGLIGLAVLGRFGPGGAPSPVQATKPPSLSSRTSALKVASVVALAVEDGRLALAHPDIAPGLWHKLSTPAASPSVPVQASLSTAQAQGSPGAGQLWVAVQGQSAGCSFDLLETLTLSGAHWQVSAVPALEGAS